MYVNDPIGDMITRIRNAQRVLKKDVVSPYSTFRTKVLDVLIKEGYIRGYSVEEVRKDIRNIRIELKYAEGRPVIEEIKRKSKPGMRVHLPAKSMPRVANGLGMFILSTSQGVMSDIDARQKGIGGELLFSVF
jgi:small subunit ribosomal protein S8